MSRLLVVAAHGDDECLGCGGILNKWQGDKGILILSTEHLGHEQSLLFADEINAAFWCSELPDNAFDTVPFLSIVKYIEHLNLIPDIILTHYEHDLNIDHRITYQAVMTAFRGQKNTIMSFEIPCSTGWAFKPFEPNVFIDIDRDKKIELLKIYDSEMRQPPHPRSYENIKDVERFKLIRGYNCIL
jgi:LmbE family N-acetylglucosaminyl deacetylase